MKNTLTLLTLLFSLSTFAAPNEVEVLSSSFGVEDNEGNPSLCLTIIRHETALMGVVEDIYDCFYARTAKRSPEQVISVNLESLKKIEDLSLEQHLQKMDGQLEFYFSDGE